MAVGVGGDGAADSLDIFREGFVFGSELLELAGVLRGEFAADFDFLLVGEPREMHGDAGDVALRVSDHIEDGVRGSGGGFGAALGPEEPSERDDQDCEKRGDENYWALHRYFRMLSWYLV